MPPIKPPIACNPENTRIPKGVGSSTNMIKPAINAHIVENNSKTKVLEAGLSKELPYPMTLVTMSKRMLAKANPII